MVNLPGFPRVGNQHGKHDAMLNPTLGETLQGDPLQEYPKDRSKLEWKSGTSY